MHPCTFGYNVSLSTFRECDGSALLVCPGGGTTLVAHDVDWADSVSDIPTGSLSEEDGMAPFLHRFYSLTNKLCDVKPKSPRLGSSQSHSSALGLRPTDSWLHRSSLCKKAWLNLPMAYSVLPPPRGICSCHRSSQGWRVSQGPGFCLECPRWL